MSTQYDVIVVGAGPSGSSAALETVRSGFRTLIIERNKLPRYKPCDGLVMEEIGAHIDKRFGLIPDEVYSKPAVVRGIQLGFHDGRLLPIDFSRPGRFVVRRLFDNFLATSSGADIHDQTTVVGLEQDRDGVAVLAERQGHNHRYHARYVVGADGAGSKTQQLVEPAFWRQHVAPYRFFMGKVHYEGRIDLDPQYWSSYFVPGVGALTLVTQKDGTITLENCVRRPKGFDLAHENLKSFLVKHHGFKPDAEIMKDGLMLNQRSTMDRFHFGRGRVLLVGEAGGFTLLWGEGIMIGIYTGREAGRAILQAERDNSDPVTAYSNLVQPLRRRSLREWNSINLLWGKPGNVGEMDPKKALCRVGWKEQLKMKLAMLGCLSGFGFSLRQGQVLAGQFFQRK